MFGVEVAALQVTKMDTTGGDWLRQYPIDSPSKDGRYGGEVVQVGYLGPTMTGTREVGEVPDTNRAHEIIKGSRRAVTVTLAVSHRPISRAPPRDPPGGDGRPVLE
eukprot:756010-Hanusia_phi.AAC.1